VIDPARWNVRALGRAWREAQPFPHVVIDRVLPEPVLAAVREAFDWEPHAHLRGELYSQMRSSQPPSQPQVRALHDSLTGPSVRAAVEVISGKRFARGDGNGYVYREGQYLLPHTDHRESDFRAVAYAFYLEGPARGGELELFDCRVRKGDLTATRSARRIRARPNRLVLFDVGVKTLHAVREVTRGARMSLAGWYYDR
jgi:Rps23 Pro-64 3,4-dihydroxylase Tpa1-like proline 4-hydroxylase